MQLPQFYAAAVLCLGLLSLTAPATAAVFVVEDSTPVQAVIESADPGDTLRFEPGQYSETVFTSKSLYFIAETPGTVIWETNYSGRAIEARSTGNPVYVQGFTFRRNRSGAVAFPESAGGALAAFSSPLDVRNCVFEANAAVGIAGAIYCTTVEVPGVSSPLPADDPNSVRLFVEDCRFEENVASSSGGAIYTDNTLSVVRNSQFVSNQANDGGAAFFLNGPMQIEGCEFTENTSATHGGALLVVGVGPLEITDSSFHHNRAEVFGGAGRFINITSVSILNSEFLGNEASFEGGALHVDRCKIQAGNSSWIDNIAGREGGAGMYLNRLSPDSGLNRCSFFGNQAPEASSLLVFQSTLIVTESLFAEPSPMRCRQSSQIVSSCILLDQKSTRTCFSDPYRAAITRCPESITQLCFAKPQDACEQYGRPGVQCSDGACAKVAVEPVRWGAIKRRFP